MNKRKLILYIACSIDGYIAERGDDLSFLDQVQQEDEDYGYSEFISSVDTVIMGRRTYDWVMRHVDRFPHADKETYVITRKERQKEGNVAFYTGELTALVNALKDKPGKNIFCDGGAEIVNLLLQNKLIDEMILSVIPVLLGQGTRLFQSNFSKQQAQLKSSRPYPSGLLQIHYVLTKQP